MNALESRKKSHLFAHYHFSLQEVGESQSVQNLLTNFVVTFVRTVPDVCAIPRFICINFRHIPFICKRIQVNISSGFGDYVF